MGRLVVTKSPGTQGLIESLQNKATVSFRSSPKHQ